MNWRSLPRLLLLRVSQVSAILGMASLGVLVLLFIAIIVLRLFGVSIPSADEFGGILLAGTLVLGLAAAVGENEHLEVRFVVDSLPARLQRVLMVGALVVAILVVGLLLLGVWNLWIGAYMRGTTMIGGLGIPRAVPIGVVLLGIALFEVALLLKLIQTLIGVPDFPHTEAGGSHGP